MSRNRAMRKPTFVYLGGRTPCYLGHDEVSEDDGRNTRTSIATIQCFLVSPDLRTNPKKMPMLPAVTHKNPVFAFHPLKSPLPLIRIGATKENMMATKLVIARPYEAEMARSRCVGTSATYTYPMAEAPVVEKIARQAKKIWVRVLWR